MKWVMVVAVAALVMAGSALLVARAAETAAPAAAKAAAPAAKAEAKADAPAKETAAAGKKDVADTLASMPELSKFVADLKTAGLFDQLKGDGPFTVIAPNNTAFENMSERMKASWDDPERKDRKVNSLKSDIVKGKMTAEELKKAGKVDTLSDRQATIESSDSKLLYNNAEIVKTDIECSNGLIQVVSAMPRGQRGGRGGSGGGRRGGDGGGN